MASGKTLLMRNIRWHGPKSFHSSKEPYVNLLRDVKALQSKKCRKRNRRPHVEDK